MQSHQEFQIVTPRTRQGFKGDVLILPDARCLSEEERNYFASYAGSGKALVITGETGRFDGTGARLASNPVHDLLRITDPQARKDGKGFIYYPKCPRKLYYARLRKEFDQSVAAGVSGPAEFNNVRSAFAAYLSKLSQWRPAVTVKASPFVSSQIASVDGRVRYFWRISKDRKRKKWRCRHRKKASWSPFRRTHRVQSFTFLSSAKPADWKRPSRTGNFPVSSRQLRRELSCESKAMRRRGAGPPPSRINTGDLQL